MKSVEPDLTGGTLTLIVHGLACPSCAAEVDRQLRQVPSVREVTMDVSAGIVQVAYDAERPPAAKDIRDAVRWGGATVISLEQP